MFLSPQGHHLIIDFHSLKVDFDKVGIYPLFLFFVVGVFGDD